MKVNAPGGSRCIDSGLGLPCGFQCTSCPSEPWAMIPIHPKINAPGASRCIDLLLLTPQVHRFPAFHTARCIDFLPLTPLGASISCLSHPQIHRFPGSQRDGCIDFLVPNTTGASICLAPIQLHRRLAQFELTSNFRFSLAFRKA